MTTPGICPKHPKQRISKETTPKTGDKPNAPCSKHTKPEHRPGSGGFFSSLLKLNPAFSLSKYADSLPYRDPAVSERGLAALRKAGLPK